MTFLIIRKVIFICKRRKGMNRMRVGNNGKGKESTFKPRSSTDEINKKSEYKGGNRIHSYEEAEKREFNSYYDSKETISDLESKEEDLYAASKYLEKAREGETAKEREERLRRIYQAQRDAQKEVKQRERESKLGLTGSKLFSMVVVGTLSCIFLCFLVYIIYMKEVKYPAEMYQDMSKTGVYALEEWTSDIKKFDGSASRYLGGTSYLDLELDYSNGSDVKKDFFNRMLSTIKYTPESVEAVNKYGNTMISKDDAVVYRDSYVDVGEEVTLSYVDYDSIQFNEDLIKSMMEDEELKLGAPGYSSKLTNLFCEYMLSISELPIKSVKYVPNLEIQPDGSYKVLPEEDIYLDKLLFSSKEFYKLIERFSLVAGKDSTNPEWEIWNALSDSAKQGQQEPEKVITNLEVTEEWENWLNSDKKDELPEPSKYNSDYIIGRTWCGAYYLQNEYTEVDANGRVVKRVIKAPLGDGSFDNPASLGTTVLTAVRGNVKSGDDIVVKEYPISVTMVDYGVSQDAINWFESKDERNRGKDVQSEVQYVYYIFEIKNLSDKTIRIADNSSISDANVNLTKRTGIIYGLTDTIVLKPNETGRIESWGAAVDLNKKYIIWGADFKREKDVVWFRKLAGDLEDRSENKGVAINRTRYRDDTVEETTTSEDLVN